MLNRDLKQFTINQTALNWYSLLMKQLSHESDSREVVGLSTEILRGSPESI
jgi:hypothetical protein